MKQLALLADQGVGAAKKLRVAVLQPASAEAVTMHDNLRCT